MEQSLLFLRCSDLIDLEGVATVRIEPLAASGPEMAF
jgi:hypothetical protein